MIKVLKWEFIKRLQEFKIFFLVLLCVSIVSLITPPGTQSSEAVAFFSSIFGFLYFGILSIYLIVATTADSRKPFSILERSITKKPWEIISAKLINNLFFMFIIRSTTYFLSKLLLKYTTTNMSNLTTDINMLIIVWSGFLLPLIIFFSYLLARSIPVIKRFPIITTVVIFIGIITIYSCLLYEGMFHFSIISIIADLIISIGLFFGCCFLYERYFELE